MESFFRLLIWTTTFREAARLLQDLSAWVRQNGMVFSRRGTLSSNPGLASLTTCSAMERQPYVEALADLLPCVLFQDQSLATSLIRPRFLIRPRITATSLICPQSPNSSVHLPRITLTSMQSYRTRTRGRLGFNGRWALTVFSAF